MAGNTLNIYTDLHTASLSAVDAAVGRLGGNNECRTVFVLIDDILPAKTVAVLFLNGTGYKNGVLVREKSQILHDLSAVYCGYDTAALVGNATAANLSFGLIAFVWIEGPVVTVADAYGINVCVKADKGFACTHKAQYVAHGINLYLVKAKVSHLFCDALDVSLLITALAWVLYDLA